jgi:hypothetical protein
MCPKIVSSSDLLIIYGIIKNLPMEVINFDIYVSLKLFNFSQLLHFAKLAQRECIIVMIF